MRKLAVLLAFVLAAAAAGAQATIPTAKAPAIQVAPGFAPEIEMVKILAKRVNLNLATNGTADAEDLLKDGKKAYETLIVIIGASGKGLGAAGVDLADEVARAARLVKKARDLGMFIIGIHVGGAERRGANTQAILPVELPYLSYLIVRKDGNEDGAFTKAAAEYKYPITEIDKTTDLQPLLKQIFKLP